MAAKSKRKPKPVEVLNSRYEGATAEDVGRALLRHNGLAPKQESEKDDDQEADAA